MNLLIRNGLVNNLKESFIADILIEEGKIKEISNNIINKNNYEELDARDKIVIPGGVDVHTHMDLDLGKYRVVDDFYTGTVAASYGGTTTIVDHIAFGPKYCSLHHMVDEYHKLARNKSVIDYSFHGVIQHVNENVLEEIHDLSLEGITSFKIYMTYDNMLKDEEILKVLVKAKEENIVIAVHAENNDAIHYLKDYYGKQKKTEAIYHAVTRPDSTEAEAINRMIYLSEIAGYPHLYFVHVSTKKGLDEIISARIRGVKNIYCETCTQYLTLTEDCYNKENYEGLKYIMAPPLRKREDIEALWMGIKDNHVDVIATDHCPFLLKEKLDGKNDFRLAPGGAPGVEERMEIVFTEGVKRGISINQLIEKLSTNPSKIFGLYPKKGNIEVGGDGDIVILDNIEEKILQNNRHGAADYTTYEGFSVNYVVNTTIQRGNIIIKNGKLLGEKGFGQFIQRNIKGKEI